MPVVKDVDEQRELGSFMPHASAGPGRRSADVVPARAPGLDQPPADHLPTPTVNLRIEKGDEVDPHPWARKYSMVLRRPSSRATVGVHPSRSPASVMSGWRCFGSSSGSGR